MGTYDVEIRDLRGHMLFTRRGIQAADEAGARDHVRKIWGPRRREDCVMTTYRQRRARGRVLVGSDYLPGSGDGGGDDGAAGVREPRRPLPGPGHLSAEAPLPEPR
ncbi:MAG TPA: hypothetical protein PKH97_11260 [Tetrasphaera sp.]|jgi:hypothetical protein|uniref:Uncharacterized protein n=1 Tax=Nostocoides vanveenii TaxID=330835 RepID=A0ABN2KSI2_9MICO|nr:hypothetical protein [Tetrasphaera sp.]HNQ07752.1 hypothetical protein [Tetrasphaera sp.]